MTGRLFLTVFNNGYQYTGFSWAKAASYGAPNYYEGATMDNDSTCEFLKANETNQGTIYAVKQGKKHFLIEHSGVRIICIKQ